MSTPSNSTLATSLNVWASSTRRNGDFPSAFRRTEERMTPMYAYQTDMIIQGKCMQLCLGIQYTLGHLASADKLAVACNQTQDQKPYLTLLSKTDQLIHNTQTACTCAMVSGLFYIHMPAHIQVLLSTFLISYLPSSSSVAPGLATNTGSEGQQPFSCHSVVCFVLVSSFISYKGGKLK